MKLSVLPVSSQSSWTQAELRGAMEKKKFVQDVKCFQLHQPWIFSMLSLLLLQFLILDGGMCGEFEWAHWEFQRQW